MTRKHYYAIKHSDIFIEGSICVNSKTIVNIVKIHGTSTIISKSLLKYFVLMSESCSVMSDSLWPHGLYSPWNSPGQNTGVDSLCLLQGIFPTHGSNPGLLHCRQILYQLSHKGSPRILEWVAYPFSSGSSPPRDWTRVSCTAGGFFTNWAIRGALVLVRGHWKKAMGILIIFFSNFLTISWFAFIIFPSSLLHM